MVWPPKTDTSSISFVISRFWVGDFFLAAAVTAAVNAPGARASKETATAADVDENFMVVVVVKWSVGSGDT